MKKINKKINIGFIGFGRVIEWQLKQIKDLNISIKFVCDLCDKRLTLASNLLDEVELINDLQIILKNDFMPDLDYVIIATPSGNHFEVGELISKAKSWKIIIEKPTFLKPEHFEYASRWNSEIIPIFQNRYNCAVVKAKELIDNNAIGEITHATLNVDWCRPQRYYDLAKWRGSWLEDGGVSTNQGIHYFDIARHLLGDFSHVFARMRRLSVNIECEDYLSAFFQMEQGIPLDVRMTTAIRHELEEASLTINGAKGTIKLFGVCCNKLDVLLTEKDKESFGEEVEMAYGYGHKKFFEILTNENEDINLTKPTLLESFKTMQFIYSCYDSAISGKISFSKNNYDSLPLGRSNNSEINFA